MSVSQSYAPAVSNADFLDALARERGGTPCLNGNANWWGGPTSQRDVERAAARCAKCPLARECLAFGVARGESGVYGGKLLSSGRVVKDFDAFKSSSADEQAAEPKTGSKASPRVPARERSQQPPSPALLEVQKMLAKPLPPELRI